MKRVCRKYWRKVRYEYHLIRRTADKKLLKEPIFTELAKDTARIKGFKLIGVNSCTTGRPDWGWSKEYDLFIQIPKEKLKDLSTIFTSKEESAKRNLEARLRLQFRRKSREVVLSIGSYQLKDDRVKEWRNRYIHFLENLTAN